MARTFRRCGVLLFLLALVGLLAAQTTNGQSRTYTSDADFLEGVLNNTVVDTDALRLDDTTEPFGFIWVAVSSKGTVVKIDTETGLILGEYYTSPGGIFRDPSRTTVDPDGNVWLTNRQEYGYVPAGAAGAGWPTSYRQMGSFVKIGLAENGQCIDRNGNGVIDTSTGQNDLRAWTNAGSADSYGGVSTALDECILLYRRVHGTGTRHVSVTASGDVWVGGYSTKDFDLVDKDDGLIKRHEASIGYGGYGGLIDANSVIWSANPLIRWDTALPLSSATRYYHPSYGLCIDSQGNVWNTSLGNSVIRKFAPNGALLGTYSQGNYYAQGCVVDANDHVWVAHSLYTSTVGHLLNDGTYVGTVTVQSGPTGVAVDNNGKIWATNYYSRTVSRIDPNLGAIGGGGYPIGAVDFTTVNLGGNPYNYSDMTGSTLTAPPNVGTWTVVYDSGVDLSAWGTVAWTAELNGGAVYVSAAVSNDGVTFAAPQDVTGTGLMDEAQTGRYVRLVARLERGSGGMSPVLYDLTITADNNEPPVCEAASADRPVVWPPDHLMVPIQFLGVTDADDDPLTYSVLSILQDEPVEALGDGAFEPDGDGLGTGTAFVRAERAGTKKVGGNGRVYVIAFEADDGNGGTCTGTVEVCVPFSMGGGGGCVKDEPLYDSTAQAEAHAVAIGPTLSAYPNPFNPATRLVYALDAVGPAKITVYDVAGRRVALLLDGILPAGTHEVGFDASAYPSGVYLARLEAGGVVRTVRLALLK